MDVTGMDAEFLHGQTVAFTGKLASMTRARAVELVRAFGGRWCSSLSKRTSLLVVGQEGWPLRKDGRLSRKLLIARKLQHRYKIEVITEADLLARLGLESETRRCLSTGQLSEILKIPGDRIRRWVELGLLRPTETLSGVHHFDFQQATWARSLCEFVTAGITLHRIRQSLEQLRRWLPEVDQPMAQLSVLEEGGHLLVRSEQGALSEPTGQGLFDFDKDAPARTLQVESADGTADDWFELACAHEDSGRLTDAAHAYRHSLMLGGPDRDTCFNLANVLHALGRKEQAAERYRQALELDHSFVEAWNNLGTVLAELGDNEESEQAFEEVLRLDPQYADAHYNLADLLDRTGRKNQAIEHFRAYLQHDSVGPWSDHARRRLRS